MEHNKRKVMVRMMGLLLAVMMLAGVSVDSTVLAAMKRTAKSKDEVVQALYDANKQQEKKLVIQYKGKDVKKVWKNITTYLWYDVTEMDDGDDSTDADYMMANADVYHKNSFLKSGNRIICNLKYYEKTSQTKKVDARIAKQIQSEGWSELSDYQKAKKVHDWILQETEYDERKKIPAVSSAAYGVLFHGKAICNGYAMAYYDVGVKTINKFPPIPIVP